MFRDIRYLDRDRYFARDRSLAGDRCSAGDRSLAGDRRPPDVALIGVLGSLVCVSLC